MLGKIQNRVWVFVAVLAAFMLTLAPAAGAQEGLRWITSVEIAKFVPPDEVVSQGLWEPIYVVDEGGARILGDVGRNEPLKVTVNFTLTNDDPNPAKITVLVKGLGQKYVWPERIRHRGDEGTWEDNYSVSQYLWTDQKAYGDHGITCILRVKDLSRDPVTGEPIGSLIGTDTVVATITLAPPVTQQPE